MKNNLNSDQILQLCMTSSLTAGAALQSNKNTNLNYSFKKH